MQVEASYDLFVWIMECRFRKLVCMFYIEEKFAYLGIYIKLNIDFAADFTNVFTSSYILPEFILVFWPCGDH